MRVKRVSSNRLNLVGLNQAAKDEQRAFKTAFFFAIIELIASGLSGVLEDQRDLLDLLIKICTILVFVFTVNGISNLAKAYHNNALVSTGNKLIILETILMALTVILDHFLKGSAADIGDTVAAILNIVIYIIYLGYLSKAKKMLAN